MKGAKRFLVALVLAFLVADVEMSAIATSVKIADTVPSTTAVATTPAAGQNTTQNTEMPTQKWYAAFSNFSGLKDADIAEGIGRIAKRLLPDTLFIQTSEATGQAPPDVEALNKQLVQSSWVLMFAAVTLFIEFVLLGIEFGTIEGLKKHKKPGLKAINAMGLISGIAWLIGFGMLVDYFVQMQVGLGTLLPTVMKMFASAFFTLQPMTALATDTPGLPFANLTGILLFHIGNLLSVLGMSKYSYDSSQPFAKKNFPFFGMILNMFGSGFLLIANYIAFYPEVMEKASKVLPMSQLTGSFLLVVAAFFFI